MKTDTPIRSLMHPASMFALLAILVVFVSWICEIYGISYLSPQTGEQVRVLSLVSPEGVRWMLRHMVTNFTDFAPLGMVLVAMLGLGVAEHSGFIGAFSHTLVRSPKAQSKVIVSVILLGILSNVIGDSGYIILLPIAASLFQATGLHPVAGIITAYVSVSCGYSANLMQSTMDPLMARITESSLIQAGAIHGRIGPLSNYWFMAFSTLLLTAIIYTVTSHVLLRQIPADNSIPSHLTHTCSKHKDRRALRVASLVGLVYFAIVLFATFSTYGILRGVSGSLIRSPFIMGVLFILSFGIGLMGMVYGFFRGSYQKDSDVVAGLSSGIRLLGIYIVIAFFASQMFAFLRYSRIDQCLVVALADFCPIDSLTNPIALLFTFTLLCALTNLFMVSATGKWQLLAFMFMPLFLEQGIGAETVQCAYRVGDSSTNAITPFLFYMPLVLAYLEYYKQNCSYVNLLRYTWRYALSIFATWCLMLLVWVGSGLPLGI